MERNIKKMSDRIYVLKNGPTREEIMSAVVDGIVLECDLVVLILDCENKYSHSADGGQERHAKMSFRCNNVCNHGPKGSTRIELWTEMTNLEDVKPFLSEDLLFQMFADSPEAMHVTIEYDCKAQVGLVSSYWMRVVTPSGVDEDGSLEENSFWEQIIAEV